MVPLRPRVLLADDYAGILTALTRLLEPSCEVVGAVTDGRALLEVMGHLAPDVIVLDLSMPEISGLEACRRIKERSPDVKVVILTAAADDALRERALRMGADAFVLKHAVAHGLPAAIRDVCLGGRPAGTAR